MSGKTVPDVFVPTGTGPSSFGLKRAFDTDRRCHSAVETPSFFVRATIWLQGTVEHVFKATHHLVLCPEVLLKTLNPPK